MAPIREEVEEDIKSNLSGVVPKRQLKDEIGKMKGRTESGEGAKKNFPSCLRNYCESRHPEHYKY